MIEDVGQGIIDTVCEPNTEDARNFSCFETGGLLIATEKYGLMLFEFGDDTDEIWKIS